MTYWINESTWDIRKGDTIKTAGINTKIMITVTDSTKKGYDMEYSFLDFKTEYLQPIITQYFIDNKSEIWLLFLIAHSKR